MQRYSNKSNKFNDLLTFRIADVTVSRQQDYNDVSLRGVRPLARTRVLARRCGHCELECRFTQARPPSLATSPLAKFLTINYAPRRPELDGEQVRWLEAAASRVNLLPQICWKDGSTWGEANLWALQQSSSYKKDIKTVARSMRHLTAYAQWLEAEGIPWWHFPIQEKDRCLDRFRGALVKARDGGQLAPSTVSQRMATVVRFYRWLGSTGLLSTQWPIWRERQIGIRLIDAFGFEHTLRVATTDLAIANRRTAGALPLEDGLMPVSLSNMHQILEHARAYASEELYLMLLLGFRSGLRIGSIADLKVQTILDADVDPAVGWHRIALGPAARPPVATKFGVSGKVPILTDVLDQLRDYIASTRRLKRQASASPADRELVFLNRNGGRYGQEGSSSLNVAMSRLRDSGIRKGISALRDFHFHRSRATFATELMRVALRCMPVSDALDMVRECCLHKDIATTLRYVKFIEKSKTMAEAADAFAEEFLGLTRRSEREIQFEA